MKYRWILAFICTAAFSAYACNDDSNSSINVNHNVNDDDVDDDIEDEVNLCGNGIVDEGEECDDGNKKNRDGCTKECKWSYDDFVPLEDEEGAWFSAETGIKCTVDSEKKMTCISEYCGNGIVDEGEECDTLYTAQYGVDEKGKPFCDDSCHFAHYCGDGVLDEEFEECDNGSDNNDLAYNGCTTECKSGPYCGDGTLDPDNEVCEIFGEDDGGCIDCQSIKEGYECDDLGICMPVSCGNGLLEFDEDCDDGNDIDGDGCSKCHIDEGYKCEHIVEKQQADENGVFKPVQVNACTECTSKEVACLKIQYGDGKLDVDGYEECDDGNTVDNDGCTHGKVDKGYVCTTIGKRCRAKTCGDGILAYGEACDDGNNKDGDGCSSRCELENGFRCTSVKNGKTTCDTVKGRCGDNIVQTGESCDDGNTANGDGCSSKCQVETNFKCPNNPGGACQNAANLCGNGKIDKETNFNIWEECDLGEGKNVQGSGCNQCRIESGFHCAVINNTYQCAKGKCRDGYKDVGEECDDGNKYPNDGCSPSCKRELMFTEYTDENGVTSYEPKCGDGITLWMIPRRDEAGKAVCKTEKNKDKGSPYTSEADLKTHYQCKYGFVPAEECDDGNLVGGDGCSRTCEIETGFSCTDFRDMASAKTIDLDITYYDFRNPAQTTTSTEPASWNSSNELTGGFMTQSVYGKILGIDSSCANNARFSGSISGATRTGYPDFGCAYGGNGCGGMVNNQLDAEGKPVLVSDWATKKCTIRSTETSISSHVSCKGTFHYWYRSTPGINITINSKLRMNQDPNDLDRYTFNASDWGPIAGKGYHSANANPQADSEGNFTSQLHTFFQYKGGETLSFRGNDDVWAFINKTLFVDLGGMQPGNSDSNTLSNQLCVLDGETIDTVCDPRYDIYENGIYELHFFQAERCWPGSDYQLTLDGFLNTGKSTCSSKCGDGIKAANEECDAGKQNKDGLYGGCSTKCKLNSHCGDGVVDAEYEDCDDGNQVSGDGCSDKCKFDVN